MTKTYIDANTLIVAFRGDHPAADAARHFRARRTYS